MAKKSERLDVVRQLAEREQEAAAKAFERSREACEREQAKLVELDRYAEEYEKQFLDSAHMRASELIRQRSFLTQLADLRRQQQAAIDRYERQMLHDRQQWHQSHLKLKAVSSVVQKCLESEEAFLNKVEEKQLDEWATQAFNRRDTLR